MRTFSVSSNNQYFLTNGDGSLSGMIQLEYTPINPELQNVESGGRYGAQVENTFQSAGDIFDQLQAAALANESIAAKEMFLFLPDNLKPLYSLDPKYN